MSETDRPNLSVWVSNATRVGNLGQRVPGEPYRPGATGTRAPATGGGGADDGARTGDGTLLAARERLNDIYTNK